MKLVEGLDKNLLNEKDAERQRAVDRRRDEEDGEMRPSGTLSGAGTVVIDGMSDQIVTSEAYSNAPSARKMESFKAMSPSVSGARESAVVAGADAPPPPPGQEPAVQVRSDFRSTILWQPDVKTDADGTATVKVKYPDSLTTWVATARVASAGNQFGIGNTSTRTKQPLIVRLQAPRFFVVGDRVTVSAVINNNTDQAMRVTPSLKSEGLTVSGVVVDGKTVPGEPSPVEVKANSEARVDWLVFVTEAREAKLKVEARGDKYRRRDGKDLHGL